jgi:polyisoprenoid-binding protein YceI
MKSQFFACLAAGFALAAEAHAADRYVIDPEHTQVVFKADRFGLSNTFGSFAEVSGELVLDETDPSKSSVRATIKVASLKSDNAIREDHLTSDRWLDATQFPEITFVSTKVEPDGEAAKVTGDLTVHGVTKPVTLDVALKKIGTDPVSKKQAAGFSATASLNRHDFGVSIAGPLIGADVAIMIETLAIKAD